MGTRAQRRDIMTPTQKTTIQDCQLAINLWQPTSEPENKMKSRLLIALDAEFGKDLEECSKCQPNL